MNYYKLEKERYAHERVRVRETGDAAIIDYRGKNVFKILYRKLYKAVKYYRIMCDRKFYIGNFALVTSYKCDLRCKGCGQHTPIIAKMKEEDKKLDIDLILSNMDKICQCVDGIGSLSIAIGEGFLNENLLKVIEYFGHNDKICYMNVPTNGSVIPNDDILEAMSKYKVTATITRYECIPQKKVDALIKKFDEYGIRYTIFQDRQWVDTSLTKGLNHTEKENREKYRNCERFWMLINNNELWKCVVCATAAFVGEVDKREEDYIDVKNADKRQLRKFLEKYSSIDYLHGCTMCHGCTGDHIVKIPAGEQMRA